MLLMAVFSSLKRFYFCSLFFYFFAGLFSYEHMTDAFSVKLSGARRADTITRSVQFYIWVESYCSHQTWWEMLICSLFMGFGVLLTNGKPRAEVCDPSAGPSPPPLPMFLYIVLQHCCLLVEFEIFDMKHLLFCTAWINDEEAISFFFYIYYFVNSCCDMT